MRSSLSIVLVALTGIVFTLPAEAYVGPGAGLSLMGALWGLVIAVVASLGFIVLWPLRRFVLRRRSRAENQDHDSEA